VADQTSASIVIAAPPEAVMAVITDFEHYPEWVDSMKSGQVLTSAGGKPKTVRMVLEHSLVKDDYVLDYTWDGDRQVSWTLVKGQMQKRQDGSYTLVEKDGSTEVTYSITIDLSIPMLGMIKRKAEKVILDTALKELKKRVES